MYNHSYSYSIIGQSTTEEHIVVTCKNHLKWHKI